MPRASVNGINLFYEVRGTGVPLVLIAGLTADSQSWLPIVEHFASHFTTIVFDNRGVGRTGDGTTPFDIRLMADDTVRLMDHLGIAAAHILGHSMGGYIVQELAINYPRRVDKLVLASTAAATSERNKALFRNMLQARRGGMETELWIRNFLFWILTPERFDNKEFIGAVTAYAADNPYPQTIEGLERQIQAVIDHDTRTRLGSIRAETLVLVGAHDLLARPGDVEMLCREIPSARPLVCLENCGHAIYMENPLQFVRTIRAFL